MCSECGGWLVAECNCHGKAAESVTVESVTVESVTVESVTVESVVVDWLQSVTVTGRWQRV